MLAWAADDAPDAAAARLRWLRRVVLAWSAVRTLVWIGVDAPLAPGWLGLSAVVLALSAALAFVPAREHLAARVALPALAIQLALTFPLTPNHWFLEAYAVVLLALPGPGGRDAPLALSALRGLTAIVLFHTGLQKLLYGHYLSGDFLAFMVGRGDRFAALFQWVLPDAEIARLTGYQPLSEGAGPYRVDSLPFVLLSNLVWIAELALPVALLWRRTRTVAAALALAFVLALQLGARELGFALLFASLVLAFAPPAWARRGHLAALGLLAVVALGTLTELGRSLLSSWHVW